MAYIKCLFVAVLLMGGALAQSDPYISDTLNNLPPELQGKVNETDIEKIKNQTTAVFREKCQKNGGLAAYEQAQKAYDGFPTCVKESLGLSDPAKLQKEIEAAKPNGTVDEVFKRYCAKTPQAKQCFRDMMDAAKPCFSEEEQKNLKTVYNITEQLAEFICYKEGDRIALFIAEGGPECFQEKQEQIQQCVNQTMGSDYSINTDNITANVIPDIQFGEKECSQFVQLQKCVVGALETCNAPTSANIVESLFKFARQATPCRGEVDTANPKSQKSEPQPKSSASGLAVMSATILVALTVVLV